MNRRKRTDLKSKEQILAMRTPDKKKSSDYDTSLNGKVGQGLKDKLGSCWNEFNMFLQNVHIYLLSLITLLFLVENIFHKNWLNAYYKAPDTLWFQTLA